MRKINELPAETTRLAMLEAQPQRVRDEVMALLTDRLGEADPATFLDIIRRDFTLGSVLRTPQAERLAQALDVPTRLVLGNVGRVILQKIETSQVREVEDIFVDEAQENYTVWFNETTLSEYRQEMQVPVGNILTVVEVLVDTDMLDMPIDMGWR
jgi:hypothetical protein